MGGGPCRLYPYKITQHEREGTRGHGLAGFNGDIKIMHRYSIHRRDYVACVSVIALSIFLMLASQNLIRI